MPQAIIYCSLIYRFQMLTYVLLAVSLQCLNAIKASCKMRLHKNGTDIGPVTFQSEGNIQEVTLFLQTNSSKIHQGYYGLHVHKNQVTGFDCSPSITGGHFNPLKHDHGSSLSKPDQRHIGDFGNIRAGERGEINYQATYKVKRRKPITASALLEPVVYCAEELADDPIDPVNYTERLEEDEGDKLKEKSRKKKQKKMKLKSKQIRKKRAVSNTDCYHPRWLHIEANVKAPLFTLFGKESIVGRAVVIHAHEDDQGKSGTQKSKKNGNAGKSIACCNLELE